MSANNKIIIKSTPPVGSLPRQDFEPGDFDLLIQQKGFDVRPILSPTVPEGQERLRFCIHSYNSESEITNVLELLSTFVF